MGDISLMHKPNALYNRDYNYRNIEMGDALVIHNIQYLGEESDSESGV